MSDLTIRPRTEVDDQQIVDIWNALFPYLPPETVEDQRAQIAATPKTVPVERLSAEDGGRVVASGVLLQMFWTKEPDRFICHVGVDRGQWGRGIGNRVYERLLERTPEFGAARLYSHVGEGQERSERFASDRGFTRTDHTQRMSRLDVQTANLEGYEGVEDRLVHEGLKIATLAELGSNDEQVLKRFYELTQDAAKDVPMSEAFVEIPYESWYLETIKAPGAVPDGVFFALDGNEMVGLAELRRQGGNSVWNAFTGVRRAYRGRGIARALKLRTVQWCRRSGVEFIYTGNDIENKRMLSMNISLGYEPLPAFLEVVKDLYSAWFSGGVLPRPW